jgi:hypothetical protein
MRFVSVRIGHRDVIDFGGGFYPNRRRGVMEQLPLELEHDLRTTTEPTLLMMDDIGLAPFPVQGAAALWFDKGVLSPHVTICGATNRQTDKLGSFGLSEMMRSRFRSKFTLAVPPVEKRGADGKPEPDAGPKETVDGPVELCSWSHETQGWLDAMAPKGLAPEISAFTRFTQGRLLYTWRPSSDPAWSCGDYRTWEEFDANWRDGERDEDVLASIIGRPIVNEFVPFASVIREMPTLDQIRLDPMSAPVPHEIGTLYLLCSSLAAMAQARDIEGLVQYTSRLDRNYEVFMMRELYFRHGAKMSVNPHFIAWSNDTRNANVFSL